MELWQNIHHKRQYVKWDFAGSVWQRHSVKRWFHGKDFRFNNRYHQAEARPVDSTSRHQKWGDIHCMWRHNWCQCVCHSWWQGGKQLCKTASRNFRASQGQWNSWQCYSQITDPWRRITEQKAWRNEDNWQHWPLNEKDTRCLSSRHTNKNCRWCWIQDFNPWRHFTTFRIERERQSAKGKNIEIDSNFSKEAEEEWIVWKSRSLCSTHLWITQSKVKCSEEQPQPRMELW